MIPAIDGFRCGGGTTRVNSLAQIPYKKLAGKMWNNDEYLTLNNVISINEFCQPYVRICDVYRVENSMMILQLPHGLLVPGLTESPLPPQTEFNEVPSAIKSPRGIGRIR